MAEESRRELIWSGSAEWDAATARARVITRALGDRPEAIQLGYDPQYPPLSTAGAAYFPFDENSGSTVTDVLNGHSGTLRGATPNQAGVLGSSAVAFDGVDDRVDVDSMPLSTPGGSWTLSGWAYRNGSNSTTNLYAFIEDLPGDENLGIGDDASTNRLKAYSRGRTPGAGSEIPLDTWFHYALVCDASVPEARAYLNGSLDSIYSIGNPSWLSGGNVITFGDRRLSSSLPLSGRLDEPLLFDGALSGSQIQALADTGSSGTLTAAPKDPAEGTEFDRAFEEDVRTTVTLDVPADTTLRVTYFEDLTGDGTADNTAAGNLADGTTTYRISGFEGDGENYWIRVEPSTTNTIRTSRAHTITLDVPYTDPTAAANPILITSIRVAGTVYDVPIYDRTAVENAAFSVRVDATTVGAARLLPAGEAPLHTRVDGTTYAVESTSR